MRPECCQPARSKEADNSNANLHWDKFSYNALKLFGAGLSTLVILKRDCGPDILNPVSPVLAYGFNFLQVLIQECDYLKHTEWHVFMFLQC